MEKRNGTHMDKNKLLQGFRKNAVYLVKWMVISCVMGTGCGLIGAAFGRLLKLAGSLSESFGFLLYLMPAAGLAVVLIHELFHQVGNKGTNLVLESVSADERIRPSVLPCIFLSAVLTHLVGGSAGKVGASIQMGGCFGAVVGEILHLDQKDRKVVVMSGMSACFGAIYGMPLAAAVFGMEVISVGVLYYAALVPCVFSSFLASGVAGFFGVSGETYRILSVPAVGAVPVVLILILGILGAVVSGLFCILLRQTRRLFVTGIHNVYLRILAASVIYIVLTAADGSRAYCGTGAGLVEASMEGTVPYEAFLLKMLFTAITLGGGFKGGEIGPSISVGACLGAAFGSLTGFSPSLCAACGMLALFAGVTNCPVAALFLGAEMFGTEALPYFAVAVAVSFSLSGYYGLYSSQKFPYSKTKTEFINRRAD